MIISYFRNISLAHNIIVPHNINIFLEQLEGIHCKTEIKPPFCDMIPGSFKFYATT